MRDYRYFASSTPGFSKDVDLQLLDLVKVQEPAHFANYVSVIIDEMYIKEGLVFDKHTGSLTGFTDLGDVCNLLAEYEQQQSGDGSMTFHHPVAKCMVIFMVQGLFTSLKFAYSTAQLQGKTRVVRSCVLLASFSRVASRVACLLADNC